MVKVYDSIYIFFFLVGGVRLFKIKWVFDYSKIKWAKILEIELARDYLRLILL